HLPKRTDNEIKNYWNTHLKKRLAKMGIDPCTHKAKSDTLSSGRGAAREGVEVSSGAQFHDSAAATAAYGIVVVLVLDRPAATCSAHHQGRRTRPGVGFVDASTGATSATSHQGGVNLEPERAEWRSLVKDRVDRFTGFPMEAAFGREAPWLSEPYWGRFDAGFTGLLLGDSAAQKASDFRGDS
ncbi:hypothetical protein BHE74_00040248, partial [Ensete ventricosum]